MDREALENQGKIIETTLENKRKPQEKHEKTLTNIKYTMNLNEKERKARVGT